MNDRKLIQKLIENFPELTELHEVNVANYGELLAYLFFMDLAEDVVLAFHDQESEIQDWRRFLAFLEGSYAECDTCGRDLIGSGLLYYLPWPGQEGAEVAEHLGPLLTASYNCVRRVGPSSD